MFVDSKPCMNGCACILRCEKWCTRYQWSENESQRTKIDEIQIYFPYLMKFSYLKKNAEVLWKYRFVPNSFNLGNVLWSWDLNDKTNKQKKSSSTTTTKNLWNLAIPKL